MTGAAGCGKARLASHALARGKRGSLLQKGHGRGGLGFGRFSAP